jgi:hypothetical protein
LQAGLQKLVFDEDLIKNSLLKENYLALKKFNVNVRVVTPCREAGRERALSPSGKAAPGGKGFLSWQRRKNHDARYYVSGPDAPGNWGGTGDSA